MMGHVNDDAVKTQCWRNFEIGRISNGKSETSSSTTSYGQFTSNSQSPISDLRCRIHPISKFAEWPY